MEEIEVLDDEKNVKPQKQPKKWVKIFLLLITIIMLLGSIGITGYLIYQNQETDKELTTLKENITKVQDKINGYGNEKQEKENEYEKLEKEMKEKIEELNIWKELKEKIETALQ